MNISYEDYYKLYNYTNIDLTDESYLEDEERLRYIISKIKVKNPKKYFKEEDGFKVTKEIFEENKEDLIILNFANGDMVGHTGDFEAATRAVETVDSCIGKILDNISLKEYTVIVTADHGNCEVMRNKDGSINTSHTTNKVPLIVTDKKVKLSDGKLGDIAPSILYLMGIDIPKEMTGNILIKNKRWR